MDIAVGFFTFNRLDTTQKVFEEIKKAKPSRLYLISDGARETKPGEAETVSGIRSYIESNIDWDCKVEKNYAEKNMGCKKRMASGITWLFEHEEQAVILEDDCLPTKDFFPFMQEMLERYKDDDRIMMVSGSMIIPKAEIRDSYSFSKYAAIWGWGSWRRAWNKYDIDIKDWEQAKKSGAMKKYFTRLGYIKAVRDFDSVYTGAKDTWDYQWSYAILKNQGLNIVPASNLIENLGFGREDATHTVEEFDRDQTTKELKFPLKHPSEIKCDEKYDRRYQKTNWGMKKAVKSVVKKLIP